MTWTPPRFARVWLRGVWAGTASRASQARTRLSCTRLHSGSSSSLVPRPLSTVHLRQDARTESARKREFSELCSPKRGESWGEKPVYTQKIIHALRRQCHLSGYLGAALLSSASPLPEAESFRWRPRVFSEPSFHFGVIGSNFQTRLNPTLIVRSCIIFRLSSDNYQEKITATLATSDRVFLGTSPMISQAFTMYILRCVKFKIVKCQPTTQAPASPLASPLHHSHLAQFGIEATTAHSIAEH